MRAGWVLGIWLDDLGKSGKGGGEGFGIEMDIQASSLLLSLWSCAGC